jgi:hypothetical protein
MILGFGKMFDTIESWIVYESLPVVYMGNNTSLQNRGILYARSYGVFFYISHHDMCACHGACRRLLNVVYFARADNFDA